MLKIAVKNLQKKVLLHPEQIKRLIKKILKEEKVRFNGEITVSVVTDNLIRKLNKLYSNKDMPTDVLAFNTAERFNKGGFIADIIVSSDTALYNCRLYGTPVLAELNLYITHGLLHLLGYNHNFSCKGKIMRAKERKYANT